MKASDYIVDFLIKKNITDAFGYPGGMVTHLMDSLQKRKDEIFSRLCYHEQGAIFAACGYAQIKKLPGFVYTTSGPGVTNLITGIANAYYDSIPLLIISGQVNTYEQKNMLKVRQKGFQETQVRELVMPIVKYSKMIVSADELPFELNKAHNIAINGRPGPVLLDIPMDIQRSEIRETDFANPIKTITSDISFVIDEIKNHLQSCKKPIFIIGNALKQCNMKKEITTFILNNKIPAVSSMIAFDMFCSDFPYYYGFIGTYGSRCANILIAKSDLIITIGTRLDCRQTGNVTSEFAKNAKLLRIDIDSAELTNKIKIDEQQYICDINMLLPALQEVYIEKDYSEWLSVCDKIKNKLKGIDNEEGNDLLKKIGVFIPNDVVITTDVGQNQVWVAQSLPVKPNQTVLFSGGHGAMGYSFPAAIGAYYATNKMVVSFSGDGGFQMNIQELQVIDRERLPVKIVVINNGSLGMIRHFQEMYFDSIFTQTTNDNGYTVPNFQKIAESYNIKAITIGVNDDFQSIKHIFYDDEPALIQIMMSQKTYVSPKLAFDKPTYAQEPLIDRQLFREIEEL